MNGFDNKMKRILDLQVKMEDDFLINDRFRVVKQEKAEKGGDDER